MATASAPASSANLGPGFDVLALALNLRCEVDASPDDRWSVRHIGPEFPSGHFDSVLEAARRAVGEDRPLALVVDNRIPIGRGLGSSAAAVVAGAAAAWRAVGDEVHDRAVFDLAADMEDHPDNAAAAIYGGLVLCTPNREVHRLPLHPGLVPILAVPDRALATSDARAALPTEVPRDVAVRSLGRLAALVGGLLLGDGVLLASAHGDEMHQDPRNRLRPEVELLIDTARTAGALHACWSGAGPSVLALAEPETAARVKGALEASLQAGRVLELQVAASGLVLSPNGTR
ncbi:MAG TPA: homoserine kinase [Acidimicrobiia bacterium]|nr:homoserine kinase [Acidimicrobiia bacterium]